MNTKRNRLLVYGYTCDLQKTVNQIKRCKDPKKAERLKVSKDNLENRILQLVG